MRNLTLILLGVVLLGVGFAAPARARPDVESAAKRWFGERPGGASVAFIESEGVTFAATGQFGPGDRRPITPDTTFEIGSVSKLFVALLLAESEKAGKVSRDDAAAKYLLPPGDPEAAKLAKITLVSLATQSSGLPRMASDFSSADGNRAGFTRAQLMAAFRRDGATAVVGGKSVYSNFGVVLLGHALAAAWGGEYPGVLQERVLDPLGLEHTWLGLVGVKAPADFPPALVKGRRVPHWEFDALAPSGALRSTARDMARFLQACLGQRETSVNASIRECIRPLRTMGDGPGKIGLNWMSTTGTPRPIYWHNGATGGFRAFVAFEPQAGIAVAVLTNTDMGSPPEALGFELMGRVNRGAPKK